MLNAQIYLFIGIGKMVIFQFRLFFPLFIRGNTFIKNCFPSSTFWSPVLQFIQERQEKHLILLYLSDFKIMNLSPFILHRCICMCDLWMQARMMGSIQLQLSFSKFKAQWQPFKVGSSLLSLDILVDIKFHGLKIQELLSRSAFSSFIYGLN